MNLDSFITLAGLFVAVWAVTPRVRRLEITLKFGIFGWAVIATASVIVIYLQFYSFFRTLGLTPGLKLSRWAITTSNASFIVSLFTIFVLYMYLRIKGLSRSNITKFREFVYELSRERKYSELFSLIEGNLNKIDQIYNGLFFGSKFRDIFVRNAKESYCPPELYEKILNKENIEISIPKKRFSSLKRSAYKLLGSFFPSFTKESETAKEILREVLLNRNTVKSIAEIRPYFALLILEKNFFETNDFFDTYLSYLAKDTKSILYHEIRNNQNGGSTGYYIPKQNRLLFYLFEDCKVAEKYGAYKPIGDFLINELDRLFSLTLPDPYNEPMGDFYEDGKWQSVLMVSIRFFDIMVTSALYQNIRWHMWLFYFRHFVDRIIRNLNPNEKLVDPLAEWPTKYHYALYEISSCLCNWVTSVERIELSQENVVLKSTEARNENGNIPKSSMLALGQVVQLILLSEKIDMRFKRYIMDMVFRRYFILKQVEKTKVYAEAFRNAIRHGGTQMLQVPIEYSQLLYNTFESFDQIPYQSELVEELQQILSKDARDGIA